MTSALRITDAPEASPAPPAADPLTEALAELRAIREALERPPLLDRLALDDVEVCAAVGIGRTTLYAAVSAGEFPAPARVGGRSVWPVTVVQQWLEEQSRKPWKPRKRARSR